MQKIIVLYHANCADGFGGAYAAWKKFGDSVTYLPLRHGKPVPEGLAGHELYFIDFCYEQSEMDALRASASRLVVLDHHEGVGAVVESMPEHVYDAKRSGAAIAWSYFHPDIPVPTLLMLVMRADLFEMLSDDERGILSYVYAQPYTFENWDNLVAKVEDTAERAELLRKGRAYTEHFRLLVSQIATKAELVSFEGHEVYLVNAPRMFATELFSQISTAKGTPFTLITRSEAGGDLRVSLRGGHNPTDLSAIARKYGGNGHPGSAAFSIPWGTPLPWKVIKGHEDPRD